MVYRGNPGHKPLAWFVCFRRQCSKEIERILIKPVQACAVPALNVMREPQSSTELPVEIRSQRGDWRSTTSTRMPFPVGKLAGLFGAAPSRGRSSSR